jgi:fused signal recognition particle receptor
LFAKLFQKIKDGLAKTRQIFSGIFRLGRRVDDTFLRELEERLIRADVGVQASLGIVERVRQAFADREVTEDLLAFVKSELKQLMVAPATAEALADLPSESDLPLRYSTVGPTVILVVGINGSGKTTSIAKLANLIRQNGKSVLLAASDTFRAGAVNQLAIWAERIGCEIVRAPQSATAGKVDPASVAHDACDKAKARGIEVVVVDTAGRLHTQQNLMQELEKIRRVVSKQIDGAPHEVLLVLDATTGQNALQQARLFTQCVQCTGIMLAKLDGTAKGGAVVAIRRELGLPVKFVGVGEKIDDIERFDPEAFVEGLFE